MVDGKVVYGAGEFGKLAPPPLPASPDWSPMKTYGGYHRSSSSLPSSASSVHTLTRIQIMATRSCSVPPENYGDWAVIASYSKYRMGVIRMYGTIGLHTFAKSVRASFIIIITVLISGVNPWVAEAQQLPPHPPYQPLRYDEDYSYLRDLTRRTEFWDIIKYVPFNDKGKWYLSVGGEVRERYEYFIIPCGARDRKIKTAICFNGTCCMPIFIWAPMCVFSVS